MSSSMQDRSNNTSRKESGTRRISVKQSASKSKHKSAEFQEWAQSQIDALDNNFRLEMQKQETLKMKKFSQLSDHVTKLENKLKAFMFNRASRSSKFHRLLCFAKRKTRQASKETQYPSSSGHGHPAVGCTSTPDHEPITNVQSGSEELSHMDTNKSTEFQAAVCQICGDRGFVEALVCCDCCKIEVIHRYCLDIKPVPFLDYITWFCEDCDADSNSDSEESSLVDIMKKSEIKEKQSHCS